MGQGTDTSRRNVAVLPLWRSLERTINDSCYRGTRQAATDRSPSSRSSALPGCRRTGGRWSDQFRPERQCAFLSQDCAELPLLPCSFQGPCGTAGTLKRPWWVSLWNSSGCGRFTRNPCPGAGRAPGVRKRPVLTALVPPCLRTNATLPSPPTSFRPFSSAILWMPLPCCQATSPLFAAHCISLLLTGLLDRPTRAAPWARRGMAVAWGLAHRNP
jgi:hypothetical protein